MANFIMVPTGSGAGVTSLALGLLRTFEQAGRRVAFFKPIAQHLPGREQIEAATHFSRQIFHLDTPDPVPLRRAEELIANGDTEDLIEEVVSRFSRVDTRADVCIIEGIGPDPERYYLSGKNKLIASALNAQVIFVVDALGTAADKVADDIQLNLQEFNDGRVTVAGYMVNRIDPEIDEDVFCSEVSVHLKQSGVDLLCLASVKYAPEKSARRMYDVMRYLNATILGGAENLAENRITEIVVAGQSGSHMESRFKAGALIVVSGGREDVLMAATLSIARGVPLAGIVLTCNEQPSVKLQKLISPILKNRLPLLLTHHDTYETARLLSVQSPNVPHDDPVRMESMIEYIAENTTIEPLTAALSAPKDLRFSPAAFRFRMMAQARAANKRIVLPEGAEPRTVQAAVICHQKGIARCVLLAQEDAVREVAALHNLALPEDLEIIDPQAVAPKYIEPLVELRKNKGLTVLQAQEYLEDAVVVGTMMMAMNEVDGLVSGAVHTTANTIRPALQLIKTAPDAALVSSIFFMLMPDQVLVYGDCAVNPDPTAEELADIAVQSADSAAAFGIEPRVAMISYSTGASGSGDQVEKVKKATALAKAKRPDLALDGPLQYDAASVPSVGRQKAPDSPVAGRATVFVFPDLNTGNTTYKAVQRSANVLSVGPMLQGLNKPVNDLSRGALIDDIVYTIAITAIQAEQMAHKRIAR